MRFDIISVFPEFFAPLELSLVGKAQETGLLEIAVHDLRDWTKDVHRTVDDTPFGGGAGMVMKPDVWAEAIDSVSGASANTVLAIPTPAGVPLTQAKCAQLAQAEQIIVACGRYEGIDARVATHYATEVEVFEYSLGDYVLNGGEVAAMALVEAVGRLVPGVIGNPDSLVEESHGAAGLLEYPNYTRPPEFRGLAVPPVLVSGDHGKISRWRRDKALERTVRIRPDLLAKLDVAALDKADKKLLAELGWLVDQQKTQLVPIAMHELTDLDHGLSWHSAQIVQVAALAARTFPDACPSQMSAAAIDAFIAEHLSASKFVAYARDPQVGLYLLQAGNELAGYSLVFYPAGDGVCGAADGAPVDFVADGVPRNGPLVYLSKAYLDAQWRGTGAAAWLLDGTVAAIARRTSQWPQPYVWLGTNKTNGRAIHAYQKYGFQISGERTFVVGDELNNDVTLVRRINVTK